MNSRTTVLSFGASGDGGEVICALLAGNDMLAFSSRLRLSCPF